MHAQLTVPIPIDRSPVIVSLPTPSPRSFSPADPADWLDALIQQTKTKYQAMRELEEKKTREDKLKRECGKEFWRDLSQWLQQVEARLNSNFAAEVLTVTITEAEDNRHIRVLAEPLRSQPRIAELHYEVGSSHFALALTNASGEETTNLVNFVLSGRTLLAEFGTKLNSWEQFGRQVMKELLT